jgi:hypothetical protein
MVKLRRRSGRIVAPTPYHGVKAEQAGSRIGAAPQCLPRTAGGAGDATRASNLFQLGYRYFKLKLPFGVWIIDAANHHWLS